MVLNDIVEVFFLRLLCTKRSTNAATPATNSVMRITRTMATTAPALRPPGLDDTSDGGVIIAIDDFGVETGELAMVVEEEEEEEKEAESEDDDGKGEEDRKGEEGKEKEALIINFDCNLKIALTATTAGRFSWCCRSQY